MLKLSLLQLKKADKELLPAQLGNFSSFLIHQSSRSTLATPCDMTSCHMCLDLCCGFMVVSMETEHNFKLSITLSIIQ